MARIKRNVKKEHVVDVVDNDKKRMTKIIKGVI